jgi:hypothetical protein
MITSIHNSYYPLIANPAYCDHDYGKRRISNFCEPIHQRLESGLNFALLLLITAVIVTSTEKLTNTDKSCKRPINILDKPASQLELSKLQVDKHYPSLSVLILHHSDNKPRWYLIRRKSAAWTTPNQNLPIRYLTCYYDTL